MTWFGEIERKLAKLSMTTLLTVRPLNYFMVAGHAVQSHSGGATEVVLATTLLGKMSMIIKYK